MVLTGKALEDFEFWLFERQVPEEYYNRYLMSENLLMSLIIDWFDTVGIVINIGGVIRKGVYSFSYDIQENNTLNGIDSYGFDSRQEAIKQAIIKANKIYNEQQQEK